MKFLVIQQKMIGDVLTTSIVCENIKKANPQAVVHYLVYPHTKAVVQNNPYIDKILEFTPANKQSKVSFFYFLKQIQAENYDTVIDAYGKIESNLVTIFSGAKIKIAWHKWYTRWIYTHTINDENYTKNAAISSRLSLLKPLGIVPQVSRPTIYICSEERKQAKKYLESNHIDTSKPIFMIGILGSNQQKTYPFEYMAKVLDYLAQQISEGIFLFNYIPNQKQDVEEIFRLCENQTQKRIRKEVYAPSLRDFLGILTYCKALIGNEGGAVNMAKALGLPTFSIFSPQISKKAWNLFSDKNNVGVHISDYLSSIELSKVKRENLYYHFKPHFFEQELQDFLLAIDIKPKI